MANFVFLDYLHDLIQDNLEEAVLTHPHAQLAWRFGLKVFPKKLYKKAHLVTGSYLFAELNGSQLLPILDKVTATCESNVVPCWAIVWFKETVSPEVASYKKYLISSIMEYCARLKAAVEKYPKDKYFIPYFIVGEDRYDSEVKDEVSPFLLLMERVGQGVAFGNLRPPASTVSLGMLPGEIYSEEDRFFRLYLVDRTCFYLHRSEYSSRIADYVIAHPSEKIITVKTTLPDVVRKVTKWEEGNKKKQEKESKKPLTQFDRKLLAESIDKAYKLYELKTMRALKSETDQMNHCVGRSNTYLNKVEGKEISIMSLSHNGKSVATLEFVLGSYVLAQCKGASNEMLEEEHFRPLVELLKKAGIYIQKIRESKVPSHWHSEFETFVGPPQYYTFTTPVQGVDVRFRNRGGNNVQPSAYAYDENVAVFNRWNNIPLRMEMAFWFNVSFDNEEEFNSINRVRNSLGINYRGITLSGLDVNEINYSTDRQSCSVRIRTLVDLEEFRELNNCSPTENGGRNVLRVLCQATNLPEAFMQARLQEVQGECVER